MTSSWVMVEPLDQTEIRKWLKRSLREAGRAELHIWSVSLHFARLSHASSLHCLPTPCYDSTCYSHTSSSTISSSACFSSTVSSFFSSSFPRSDRPPPFCYYHSHPSPPLPPFPPHLILLPPSAPSPVLSTTISLTPFLFLHHFPSLSSSTNSYNTLFLLHYFLFLLPHLLFLAKLLRHHFPYNLFLLHYFLLLVQLLLHHFLLLHLHQLHLLPCCSSFVLVCVVVTGCSKVRGCQRRGRLSMKSAFMGPGPATTMASTTAEDSSARRALSMCSYTARRWFYRLSSANRAKRFSFSLVLLRAGLLLTPSIALLEKFQNPQSQIEKRVLLGDRLRQSHEVLAERRDVGGFQFDVLLLQMEELVDYYRDLLGLEEVAPTSSKLLRSL
ncbi:hypothetical protein C7M84_016206 [Penaeus vannamei]|uniref:Uncharacterized protein n=1 Tax=Penaeus vannamei TaxID=6689 RepID=A0A3R7NSU5_PENVA|nr:hypothetical protein C7M84_016206 [Penaeus vannamei]